MNVLIRYDKRARGPSESYWLIRNEPLKGVSLTRGFHRTVKREKPPSGRGMPRVISEYSGSGVPFESIPPATHQAKTYRSLFPHRQTAAHKQIQKCLEEILSRVVRPFIWESNLQKSMRKAAAAIYSGKTAAFFH